MRADALVLDLDTRAGLCIARSLGRAGLTVSVGAREHDASGLSTRYAARRCALPDPEADLAAYRDAIVAELNSCPADAVLATIDSSIEALHRGRDALSGLTAPAIGSVESVEVALSKERTLEVASRLGVPVPRSLAVSTPEEAKLAAAELGVPCVLKPVSSWRNVGDGGERVSPVILTDLASAEAAAARLVRPDAPALVQELAPGTRETIKLFRAGGATLARLAMVVDRCWPPLGGSSTMRHVVEPPPDALGHAERLVAEIGLEGYSEVEFRRSADGRPLLMEINPRLSQSVEVAVRAGFDFPRMQLEWARGGRIPEPPARSPVGLRVGWLAGDLRLLVGAAAGSPPPRPRLGRTLAAIGSDYVLRRARLEGLDRHDPRPVAGALAFPLRRLVRRTG